MISYGISECAIGIFAEMDLFEEITIVEIVYSRWCCAQMPSPGNILIITDWATMSMATDYKLSRL
jgi:hypothetical protein